LIPIQRPEGVPTDEMSTTYPNAWGAAQVQLGCKEFVMTGCVDGQRPQILFPTPSGTHPYSVLNGDRGLDIPPRAV